MIYALIVLIGLAVWLAACAKWQYERAEMWKLDADLLADELARWGWGDMHYGETPQEPRIVARLAQHERAHRADGAKPAASTTEDGR